MSRAAWICGVAIVAAGCDDTIWSESAELAEPPSQDGFAGVQEISRDRCEGCHNPAGMEGAGGLDLSTDLHAATVGVLGLYGLPLVTPGDPENSMFYLKMTDAQPENTGTDMPPGSGGLPTALSDVVEDWILDGAPAQ